MESRWSRISRGGICDHAAIALIPDRRAVRTARPISIPLHLSLRLEDGDSWIGMLKTEQSAILCRPCESRVMAISL